MTLFGKCMDLRCSVLEQTYFKEICEEIGRAKEAILPINNFYDRPMMLQNLLINSNDIHFTMLEVFLTISLMVLLEPKMLFIIQIYLLVFKPMILVIRKISEIGWISAWFNAEI